MMFNWDDILIVGGSVAGYRTEADHWPKVLTCMLTNTNIETKQVPRGIGMLGCAWWSVKKVLEKELNKSIPKVLIICHSESSRIPNDYDLPLNHGITIFTEDLAESIVKEKNLSKDIIIAAKYYYKHLISMDFHIWAHTKWFEEVDEKTKDIPYVIHMLQSSEQYEFKNGITLEQSLEDLMSLPFWDSSPNHFTPEENIKLAKEFHNLITNFQGNCLTKINW